MLAFHLFLVVFIKTCVICLCHVRTKLYLVDLIVFTVFFKLIHSYGTRSPQVWSNDRAGGRRTERETPRPPISIQVEHIEQSEARLSVLPGSSKLSDVSVVNWQLTGEEWQNKCEIMIMWWQFILYICEILYFSQSSGSCVGGAVAEKKKGNLAREM